MSWSVRPIKFFNGLNVLGGAYYFITCFPDEWFSTLTIYVVTIQPVHMQTYICQARLLGFLRLVFVRQGIVFLYRALVTVWSKLICRLSRRTCSCSSLVSGLLLSEILQAYPFSCRIPPGIDKFSSLIIQLDFLRVCAMLSNRRSMFGI